MMKAQNRVLELLGDGSRTPELELDNPTDDFLAGLGRAALVVLLAIGAAVGAGAGFFSESDHASVAAKLEADAAERKALRPYQLSNPLPCDLTLKEMVGPVVLREECYRRPQP